MIDRYCLFGSSDSAYGSSVQVLFGFDTHELQKLASIDSNIGTYNGFFIVDLEVQPGVSMKKEEYDGESEKESLKTQFSLIGAMQKNNGNNIIEDLDYKFY